MNSSSSSSCPFPNSLGVGAAYLLTPFSSITRHHSQPSHQILNCVGNIKNLMQRRRRAGVLGPRGGAAAAVQDGEPEAVPAAAAAVQVRLEQHRGHRVRAAGLHGPSGQQRAHRHVAQLAAPQGRRLGLHAGTQPCFQT
jgi:hypothetical protein